MSHRTRALLLDLDGTVADTHAQLYHCLDHSLHQHLGAHFEREWWRRSAGLTLTGLFSTACREMGRPEPEADLHDALVATFRARQAETNAGVQAFPGIAETLAAIKANGIRLAIVSTKHAVSGVPTLGAIGLAHLFDAVVFGDHCANYKPHPEPFQRALCLLGAESGDASAVGDSPSDILGARAAGVHASAALWGAMDVESLLALNPDSLLHEPPEMLSLVGIRK